MGLFSKLKTKEDVGRSWEDVNYGGQKNSILESLDFDNLLCDIFLESENKKHAKQRRIQNFVKHLIWSFL